LGRVNAGDTTKGTELEDGWILSVPRSEGRLTGSFSTQMNFLPGVSSVSKGRRRRDSWWRKVTLRAGLGVLGLYSLVGKKLLTVAKTGG